MLLWEVTLSHSHHDFDQMFLTVNGHLHTVLVILVKVLEQKSECILEQPAVPLGEALFRICPFVTFQNRKNAKKSPSKIFESLGLVDIPNGHCGNQNQFNQDHEVCM